MKVKKEYISLYALLLLLLISSCQPESVNFPEAVDEIPPAVTVDSTKVDDEPVEGGKSGDLIPDGVLVSMNDGMSLTYLDEAGQLIWEIQTPGIDTNHVVIAGHVFPGEPMPPVIYRTWQPEIALVVNTNGDISMIREAISFHSMAGAPGQNAVAFSEMMINTENLIHSFLYAGKVDDLSSAAPIFDLTDEPNDTALIPVGVHTLNGETQGVWFTKMGWGIGGADLIFAPSRGLYFYDLTTNDSIQHLTMDSSFQGISPDLTHAGYIDYPMKENKTIQVIDMLTRKMTSFDLDPSSDRGAGFVVFSPDNAYAAWLEASGSMISDTNDFHPVVRIGDVQTGSVVEMLEATDAIRHIESDLIGFLRPVGWLTEDEVLVESRGENWDDAALILLDIISGDVSAFASGSFVAFGYQ